MTEFDQMQFVRGSIYEHSASKALAEYIGRFNLDEARRQTTVHLFSDLHDHDHLHRFTDADHERGEHWQPIAPDSPEALRNW